MHPSNLNELTATSKPLMNLLSLSKNALRPPFPNAPWFISFEQLQRSLSTYFCIPSFKKVRKMVYLIKNLMYFFSIFASINTSNKYFIRLYMFDQFVIEAISELVYIKIIRVIKNFLQLIWLQQISVVFRISNSSLKKWF